MSDQHNPNPAEPADASANASGAPPVDSGGQPSGTPPGGDSAANNPPTPPTPPVAPTLKSAAEYFPNGLTVDTGDGGSVIMKHGQDPVFDAVLNTMHAQGLTAEQAERVSTSFVQEAHKHAPKPPTEAQVSSDPMFGGNGPQHMAEANRTYESLIAEGLMTPATLEALKQSGSLNEPGLVLFFSQIGARLRPGVGPSPAAPARDPAAKLLTNEQARVLYRDDLKAAGNNKNARIEASRRHDARLIANNLA